MGKEGRAWGCHCMRQLCVPFVLGGMRRGAKRDVPGAAAACGSSVFLPQGVWHGEGRCRTCCMPHVVGYRVGQFLCGHGVECGCWGFSKAV
eukprot:364452-Chlamydomonas_euryale.AAC.2